MSIRAKPATASAENYKRAILAHNILDNSTASNRLKTYRYLRSQYALDPEVCPFREMRRLMQCATDDARLMMDLLSMVRELIAI